MRTELPEENDAEIQMSPLIDCVFLLLIFFLVATTLKKIDRELPIQLPNAVRAIEAAADNSMLIIGVDELGRPYLDGALATPGQLLDRLNGVMATDPDRRIRIDADRDTNFQDVVHILEALNVRSLKNVSVRVGDHDDQNQMGF